MYSIRKITGIEKFIHPAVIHQTLVKKESRNVEIWMQTSQPGKPTPTHYHSGEEILIVLKGTGWCQVDGKQIDFGPNSVLTVLPTPRIKSAQPVRKRCRRLPSWKPRSKFSIAPASRFGCLALRRNAGHA